MAAYDLHFWHFSPEVIVRLARKKITMHLSTIIDRKTVPRKRLYLLMTVILESLSLKSCYSSSPRF